MCYYCLCFCVCVQLCHVAVGATQTRTKSTRAVMNCEAKWPMSLMNDSSLDSYKNTLIETTSAPRKKYMHQIGTRPLQENMTEAKGCMYPIWIET